MPCNPCTFCLRVRPPSILPLLIYIQAARVTRFNWRLYKHNPVNRQQSCEKGLHGQRNGDRNNKCLAQNECDSNKKKNISTIDEGTEHLGWWYVTRLHLQIFGGLYGSYCEGLNKKKRKKAISDLTTEENARFLENHPMPRRLVVETWTYRRLVRLLKYCGSWTGWTRPERSGTSVVHGCFIFSLFPSDDCSGSLALWFLPTLQQAQVILPRCTLPPAVRRNNLVST